MSSLSIMKLPLGGGPPYEEPAVSLIVEWEKDAGYVAALQTSVKDGTAKRSHLSRHGTPKDALLAAIELLNDYGAD